MKQRIFKEGHWISYNGEIFRLKSFDGAKARIGKLEYTSKDELVVNIENLTFIPIDDSRIRFFRIYIPCRPHILSPEATKPIANFPKLVDFEIDDRKAIDLASEEGCYYLHEFQDWVEKKYRGATVNF